MAEYAVILAVITPAIVAAYALFSGAIGPLIMQVVDFL
jgi:Flp pilus assembly pilin Flp